MTPAGLRAVLETIAAASSAAGLEQLTSGDASAQPRVHDRWQRTMAALLRVPSDGMFGQTQARDLAEEQPPCLRCDPRGGPGGLKTLGGLEAYKQVGQDIVSGADRDVATKANYWDVQVAGTLGPGHKVEPVRRPPAQVHRVEMQAAVREVAHDDGRRPLGDVRDATDGVVQRLLGTKAVGGRVLHPLPEQLRTPRMPASGSQSRERSR